MVFEKVKKMIVQELKVPESAVTLEARLQEDLKADSANVMMLVMDIEQDFDITVEDDAITTVKTVGDLVRYIENKQ
ncbi:MAG TPA: acyl carrier protein [Candidatus Onthenecus intestinigallinarum]|uniref:Acyl carrier protein n=1 Tax=Candidatus Onthenecus intestinigallinarum TaxID=2840875 RepID=A0A9D0ZBD6_9FIRM|nr:acyl carrier protein [Candidatus Onthenecus intestinigallinarum]